jgi:hypothetical protein
MEILNPHTGDKYVIRLVPLDEAHALRRNGTVFYDFTKLTAVNTCPTWGVLRYGLHRTDIPLTVSGRNLAIECGKACHDFFAAVRMHELLQRHDIEVPRLHSHAHKLFGRERWESMLQQPQDSDPQTNCLNFALDALHTSGYYDDPSDRKRTLSNMEASCIAYLQRYMQSDMPVYVDDKVIGVEVPFVLEVKQFIDGLLTNKHYYCGRIDGLQQYGNDVSVCENKTAAQLSSTWKTAFAISAQVTGYTIAGSVLLGREVTTAFVMGTQIPLPRDVYNGVVFEPQSRGESDRLRWCEWFFHIIETYEAYIEAPTLAPRYSHSCNRYFSACQFIPFCASTREEQDSAIGEMRVEEWSPLDHLDSEGVE